MGMFSFHRFMKAYMRTVFMRGSSGLYTPNWNPLGPDAPGGLTVVSNFQGDMDPQRNQYSGGGLNANRMGGLRTQMYCYKIVPSSWTPSGFMLRLLFPNVDGPDAGRAWTETDFGGQAAARMAICGSLGSFRFKTLYVHSWRYLSPNFTQANAKNGIETVHFSGTSSVGTTASQCVCTGAGWSTNEHQGRFLRLGTSGRGAKIASNTSDTVLFADGDQIGGDLTGQTVNIFTVASTGAAGSNAGTKGPFFLNIGAQLDWAGTDPQSADKETYDNHYVGGYHNPGAPSAPATGEGISMPVSMQNNKTWDGVEVDGGGYPVWRSAGGGGGNFGAYPGQVVIPGMEGQVLKEQFILQIGTPGGNDGKYRYYLDGVLTASDDDVPFVEPWYSAQSMNMMPNIGGLDRDVALTPTDPYWNGLDDDRTYGGGLRCPTQDMYQDLGTFAVAGSTSFLI